MPDHYSLAEKLKMARDRSAQELEVLGEGFEEQPAPPATDPAQVTNQRPVPKENIGVGRDLLDETTRAVMAQLDARIVAFQKAGNAAEVAKLKARKKAILEEAERVRAEQQ